MKRTMLIAAGLLAAALAAADTVKMKDGTVHEGRVIVKMEDAIWLKTADGKTLQLKRADIKDIAAEEPDPAETAPARPARAPLMTDMEKAEARLRAAETEWSEAADAIRKLMERNRLAAAGGPQAGKVVAHDPCGDVEKMEADVRALQRKIVQLNQWLQIARERLEMKRKSLGL